MKLNLHQHHHKIKTQKEEENYGSDSFTVTGSNLILCSPLDIPC
jgi:hypothetical protein